MKNPSREEKKKIINNFKWLNVCEVMMAKHFFFSFYTKIDLLKKRAANENKSVFGQILFDNTVNIGAKISQEIILKDKLGL